MNVLVVGCGKVGSRLARLLAQRGHNVSVIDREEDMFSQLGEDFDGVTVTGMPMDMDVLRNAGVEWCDAVAVVTPDDNLNITISQIVKTFFQVENVVTRISDPAREIGVPSVRAILCLFYQFGSQLALYDFNTAYRRKADYLFQTLPLRLMPGR